ncbi:MAG TPA: FmdB family zinc ribbon protein [Pyrinomonadaceae bacterium]
MPIYEYTCRKCNAHVEVMQKISDKPLARHAGCGGRLEKEWSRSGFQFKGSGWYVTDYAAKKSDAKTGEAKEGKEAKESKESAPAEKSESSSSKSESSAEAPKESAKAGAEKPKGKKGKDTPAGA